MAMGVSVEFSANLAKFNEQVDKAYKKLDDFGKRTQSMTAAVNNTLSTLGVGLSAAGLAAFVKSGIDAADAMNDLADRSGIAIEKLAGLEYAVKIGDTTMESFISASNKLSINIAKNGEDFAKLGITAKDPVEAFKQLADVFSSIEDPQKRAALGAAALGKSYAEMAPLLMMGADGIQQLIDKGREHNPVTAEQARLAGEFNDKLEELRNRSSAASIVIAGPLVEALNAFAQGIAFANEQADGFDPLGWLNAGGYGAAGKSGQLQYLNEQINETSRAIDNLKTQGVGGQLADILFGGENIEDLDAKLMRLTKARDALLSPPAAPSSPATAPAASAIDAFIKKTDEAEQATKKLQAANRSAASGEAARAQSIQSIVESLQFDISLTGQSAEQQALFREIRTATAKATTDEAAAITALIKKKYDLIEADQILADGERLASQQRKDAAAEYDRLMQAFSGENQAMYSQFDDAFKARGLGIIDDNQLARSLENISQGFDAITGKAKDSTEQMSKFADEAARNMQDAFADFLFDPFDKGMDGMLQSFLDTAKRMAANAASANIMEGLFGKQSGGSFNFSGGLLGKFLNSGSGGGFNGSGPLMSFQNPMSWGDVGSWFSGIGSSIGGFFGFEKGGIMTQNGPVPLRRYARGGVANSPQLALYGEGSMNEAFVPLPDGRRIPVTMQGGGRPVVNNVTINISTPNADSFRRSERQIRDQMLRALNV